MIPNRALERQKQLAKEAWTYPDHPKVMYHGAPRRFRSQIQQEGLLASQRPDPNYPHGVFLSTDPAEAADWGYWKYEKDPDVWAVNVDGLTLEVDPNSYNQNGEDDNYYCATNIGPERLTLVENWRQTKIAYPDQGGGDPRPDKMGPTLNTDYAPLEDTFDALGPCQKCNNPLTRDAEGVYCPSCGYRSNPDAQNARIDMYAPLGEGIGEGPFGLMSKQATKLEDYFTVVPGVGYHAAPVEARSSILQNGLDYDLRDKSYDWREEWDEGTPEAMAPWGNYLWLNLWDAEHYASGRDIWKVDYTGLNTIPDPNESGLAVFVKGRIPHGRLELIVPGDGRMASEGKRKPSYWVMEGSQLPWWLPSKTAADVQELAAKASDKIWQRPDLAKYLNALNEVIDILGESGLAVDLSDFYEEDNTAFDMLVRSYDQYKQAGEEWDSDHVADIMKQNYGYGEQYIRDAINATPKIAPLWQDFKLGRLYHELISTMAGRYPAGYKLIPWGVNQLKKQLKDHYDINRNDVNHLADIAGQFGELTTELRRQNKLPQGFDVNGVDMAGAEDWMREYHAQHIGEGWDERKVWATLPNGWTVEQVSTPGDLKREGELMGHCVGGYCRQVDSGRSIIFSLRDPNGAPHVTFEYKPLYQQTNEDGSPVDPKQNQWIDSNKITRLELVQVQGKSDSKPKPEYQQMVAEFNKYLQGEGYQVTWSQNAWRHDRGQNDTQLMQLRNENTYDLRGIEGLHKLEQDYDQNGGTSYFTKQLPDIPDEYGILSPSGVPEQHLNWGQLSTATDELLYKIFEGKITPDQYEEYGRKLTVAWYSFLSQPFSGHGYMSGGGQPKSPVDARTFLVQHIAQWGSKLVGQYNKERTDINKWQVGDSEFIIDAMTRLTAFQQTIGGRTGTQMLDWTIPAQGSPNPTGDSTVDFAQRHRWDSIRNDPGATAGDYIPQDEPGFHPEAAAPPEYVPYKFIVGKDGRIYGGQAYEHRPLIEGYGLDRDPGWTEVARGEYNPDGGMTLAEFANSPFGAENLANRVHQWAGTVNDPNIPMPNGDVRYNQWIQGQGWDKRQFRIAAAKWSVETLSPTMPDINYVMDYNPEDERDTGWQAYVQWIDPKMSDPALLDRMNRGLQDLTWEGTEFPQGTYSPAGLTWKQAQRYLLDRCHGQAPCHQIANATPDHELVVESNAVRWTIERVDVEHFSHTKWSIPMTIPHEAHTSAWKYAADSIPANYTESDPLDLQGKQPVFDNMQVDWWKLPPVQQRQAIVNAFRATMLSPRLNLKNNAIMYQEFMAIPADESDPDVFEQHARDLKERWDRQGQGDLMNEVQPIGWEKVVPGKLIPGFWGNIRRIAALGPYADDLRQAALDDLNKNGGRGTLFRQEVLKLGIPGVGPKVASFAWLALNPKGSDLATIDVWMMRHLQQEQESPNTPSHYFELEDQLRDEKDKMYGPNVPLGQYQWGVWDKIRTPGFHQDHSPLKVYDPTPYTDVAWTQQYRAPRPQQLPEQAPGQEQLFANRNG